MMKFTDDLIVGMKSSQRLKLSFWNSISHYWVVLLMALLTVFWWYQLIKSFLTQSAPIFRGSKELFNVGCCLLIVTSLFFVIQYRRLTFKKVVIKYNDASFKQALSLTIEELKWIVSDKNNVYVSAFHKTKTYFNWGELITIIKIEEGILINSICDPEARTALFSLGWNRKNVNTFIRNLEHFSLDK